MGLWQRFVRLVKSNLNSWVAKAEDTEKIVEQALLDMHDQLKQARDEVASAIADEKSLWKQWTEEFKQAEAWEKRAIRAVQLGDDRLAKEALVQKSQHQNVGQELQTQWEIQKASVEKLKEALQILGRKIEEAQRKKTLLLARKKRAEAHATVQTTLSSLADNSAFETFERMAQRVERMELEVEARAEIEASTHSLSLEERFRALERGADSQDDALAALKAKLALSAAPSSLALPASSQPTEAQESPKDLQIEVERIRERLTISRD